MDGGWHVMYSYVSRPDMAELRKEYGAWLLRVFGSSEELMMGTFTFRNPDTKKYPGWTSPGKQYVTRAAQSLERMLESYGSSAFVCVEEGTDTRRLHLHSLSSCESRVQLGVKLFWEQKHGHVKLVNVKSREGVSMYVTKYVTKSDLLFFAGGPAFKLSSERVDDSRSGGLIPD